MKKDELKIGMVYYNSWDFQGEQYDALVRISGKPTWRNTVLYIKDKDYNKSSNGVETATGWREATPKEIQWLEACEAAGEYVPCPETPQHAIFN